MLLTLPGGAEAAPPPAGLQVIEVNGVNSPAAVDDQGDVLPDVNSQGSGSIWRGGSLVPSPDANAVLRSLNGAGVAVGTLHVATYTNSSPYTEDDAFWWDTKSGQTWHQEAQGTSGYEISQSGLGAVDAQNEAGGLGSYQQSPSTGGSGGAIFASAPGAAFAIQTHTPAIIGLNQGWELLDDRTPDAVSTLPYTQLDRATGTTYPVSGLTVQPGLFGGQTAIGADGSVLGRVSPAGEKDQAAVELPGGRVIQLQNPVAAAYPSSAYDMSDAGVIVGSIAGQGVVWPSATSAPIDLNYLLPSGSPWKLKALYHISQGGNFAVGLGLLNGQTTTYEVPLGTPISGTVYGNECTDSSCTRSGLGGIQVLATGTATSGAPSSASAVTGADGTYTMFLAPGSYTLGPSQDGTTVETSGFDAAPAVSDPLTVGQAPLTGLDFSGCVADAATLPSAADRPAPRARAASALAPIQCTSIYRFDVAAKIPQAILADPSLLAHFNVDPNPQNNGYNLSRHGSWRAFFSHSPTLRRFLGLATEFPDCFSEHRVEDLSEHHAGVEWYSEVHGGPLGDFSVPVSYNQDTGEVHVAAAPTLHYARIQKELHWVLHEHGQKPQPGHCTETALVPMLVLPVGGGDLPGEVGAKNSFTLLMAWGFPFNPLGSKLLPESTVLSSALSHLGAAASQIYSAYNSLNPAVKFVLDLGVSVALESAGIKALQLGARLFTNWERGGLFAAGVATALERYAVLRETLHKVKVAQEYLGFVLGSVGEHDHYPVMGAVARVHFRVARYLGVTAGGTKKAVPQDTQVAMSVASTRFPTIAIGISRWAYPKTASSGPSTGQVFGAGGPTLLPWTTSLFKNPQTNNPASNNSFASHAPFVFADPLLTGHAYSSGRTGVDNVVADTGQLPALADSFRNGTLSWNFTAEQAEAPAPNCDVTTNKPLSLDTICWKFDDARP